MSKVQKTPLYSERYDEKTIRQRIRFGLTIEYVKQLIQEESEKLAEGLRYE